MKFKILKLLLFIPILLGIIPLSSCENNENKLVIAEVTHSIFYAPMYVAKNKGFFKDEGLDVEIVTTPGVMRNVRAINKRTFFKIRFFSSYL